ncbi:MAG: Rne/Rng family ribonuclease [Methylocystaceae bacterium]
MHREIVIEKYPWETRTGILEDGELVEVWCDDREEKVGNIYKCRVEDVVPGLSCAFVNIGLARNAFLYVADISVLEGIKEQNITNLVRPGQELLVQVRKEAFQEKGARVTTNLTLPGRFVVLLPFKDDISISRKIEDSSLRQKLKAEISSLKPDGVGVIIRTAASSVPLKEVEGELQELFALWNDIYHRYKEQQAPAMLYEDVGTVERALRDYLDGSATLIILNDEQARTDVLNMMGGNNLPQVTVKVETGDVFGRRNLDKEIKRALRRRVWLKSGGFLIVDETEAMTVFDVNSGRYIGQDNLADTVLKINLEAAKEIPRQLRLRGVGGIILIDFIDMESEDHQRQVTEVLNNELDRDKAHTRVLGFTRLGFLEMTRKKSRYGVREYFARACTHCNGIGLVWKEIAVLNEIKRKLSSLRYLRTDTIICELSSHLEQSLLKDNHWNDLLTSLRQEIRVVVNSDLEPMEYRLLY